MDKSKKEFQELIDNWTKKIINESGNENNKDILLKQYECLTEIIRNLTMSVEMLFPQMKNKVLNLTDAGQLLSLLNDEFDIKPTDLYFPVDSLEKVNLTQINMIVYQALLDEIGNITYKVLKEKKLKEEIIDKIIDTFKVEPFLYGSVNITSQFLDSSGLKDDIYSDNVDKILTKEYIETKIKKFIETDEFKTIIRNIVEKQQRQNKTKKLKNNKTKIKP